MKLARISDMNIEDDIIRALLYRDILTYVATRSPKHIEYEIKADELYRPDLVAYRVYGNLEARWIAMLICGVEDDEYPLPVATTLTFPDLVYVRERIRHYAAGGGL
ncbi:MAG: hypothetical protein ACRDCT_15130 [Shewanella sp.]|uniref:hypothetical protein n=1 Tax=Shewanella sp. TaxID=50422 RepID=UPI003F40ECE9